MKRFLKFSTILTAVALLLGVIITSVYANGSASQLAPTYEGISNSSYESFDSYETGSEAFDKSTVNTSHFVTDVGSYMYGDAQIKVKEHMVDGEVNKYLDFTAVSGYTTSGGNALFASNVDLSVISDSVTYKYSVFDIDLTSYQYVAGDKLYSSIEEIKDESLKETAKLAYPEGLYINCAIQGYNSKGSSTGIGFRKIQLKSKNNNWYLANNGGTIQTAAKLSAEPGEWNHLTVIVEYTGTTTSYANKFTQYVYLNGEYMFKESYSGYSSTTVSAKLTKARLYVPESVVVKDEPSYSFAIDNWAVNSYNSTYEPTVKNSLMDLTLASKDNKLYDCDDVVYNKNYISPNSQHSLNLKWVDLDGNKILGEEVVRGEMPNADKAIFASLFPSKIKGSYSTVAAWEWNVNSDDSVYTPVSEITDDIVSTVRTRGNKTVTVRPVVLEVNWYGADGKSFIGSEEYFAGSVVSGYDVAGNGWYSVSSEVGKNITNGEAEDSFTVVSGKVNKFTVDADSVVPIAKIDGVKYNMSLQTDFKINIFVPTVTVDGVSFKGFYGDEALQNEIKTGLNTVTVNDVTYNVHSFGIANSDIDVTIPKYVGIEVLYGGKTYTLSYEIKVNLLSYCNGILSSYDCGSYEASLVANLLRYSNEAYTYVNGTVNEQATLLLGNHTECGCLLSTDVTHEYKGDPSGLVSYLYGVSYEVTSAQPGLVVYLFADKVSEVSKITVGYKGLDSEVSAEMRPASKITVEGVELIPYRYNTMYASDINELMTINVLGASDATLASGTYCLTNYVFENDVAVADALYAFGRAAKAYKQTTVNPAPDETVLVGITANKTASVAPSMTLNIGDEITYTISVTNESSEDMLVPITDKIPANTKYVSGAELVEGINLSWSLNVPAGETASVSYTVKIDEKEALYDGAYLKADNAKAGGNAIDCYPVYVARTFNRVDAEYVKVGVNALRYSEFTDVSLARWIYYVAFSQSFTLGNVDAALDSIFSTSTDDTAVAARKMVAPTLYGGNDVSDELDSFFLGERAVALAMSDFVAGDILLVDKNGEANIYIHNGDKLFEITDGMADVDSASVIADASVAERYAVLRPSMVMSMLSRSEINDVPLEINEAQAALIATARAYVLRGYRLQYDDTRLVSSGSTTNSEFRWQIGINNPEDYTSDEWGYINCAGFTYDIYRMVLGENVLSMYTTGQLVNYTDRRVFYYKPTKAETDEEKAEVENNFLNTLEVGDLVVVRRGSNSGHVMMYIGNGKLVHSTGSSYDYDTSSETYEPTIRYMNVWDYLFKEGSTNYVFDSKVDKLAIIRPVSNWDKVVVNDNTKNRVENMQGIVAEKLSSHKAGATVNPGDEITFTFKIFNTNDTEKTLIVTDVVPTNTIYISGAENVNGTALSWTVTVPAGMTVEVSYTVKVNQDASFGDCVYSDAATVGGVLHSCNKVYIKRTLTKDEQAAIDAAIKSFDNSEGLKGFDLLNAIYKAAGITDVDVFTETATTNENGDVVKTQHENIDDALFNKITVEEKTHRVLNVEGKYYNMIAPTIYGGRDLYTENRYSTSTPEKPCTDRTRLAREHDLVVGDILVTKSSKTDGVWLYTSEGFIALHDAGTGPLAVESTGVNSRLQYVLSYKYFFVVLRPSMDMQ